VARFRLRFLLQEFDLAPGETVLGRSPECHITIDDPLLSRQHAKIVVTPTTATLYDLGSRNGSRVNGRLLVEPQPLHDGDRLRLGTQELVFFGVRSDLRAAKATGAMRLCQHCTTPFPEGPSSCPHCGKPVRPDEDTMSGVSGMSVRQAWILQMLNDMLDRVLRGGRAGEAEKLLYRAAEETENRMASNDIDATQFVRTADLALQFSLQQRDPRWSLWVLDAHRRSSRPLAASTVDGLYAVFDLEAVPAAVAEYLEACRASGALEEQGMRLARLLQSVSTIQT
jgi:FHA domain